MFRKSDHFLWDSRWMSFWFFFSREICSTRDFRYRWMSVLGLLLPLLYYTMYVQRSSWLLLFCHCMVVVYCVLLLGSCLNIGCKRTNDLPPAATTAAHNISQKILLMWHNGKLWLENCEFWGKVSIRIFVVCVFFSSSSFRVFRECHMCM